MFLFVTSQCNVTINCPWLRELSAFNNNPYILFVEQLGKGGRRERERLGDRRMYSAVKYRKFHILCYLHYNPIPTFQTNNANYFIKIATLHCTTNLNTFSTGLNKTT
jgi:hypothetical protein